MNPAPAAPVRTARAARVCVVLIAIWLVLRLGLFATGAELGEARTLSLGAHRVAVLLFRDAIPRDTLLVATHGGLSSKESLMAVCWEARRRGADCVAVDALGHGASSAQPALHRLEEMHAALRVAPQLGSYRHVRFLGHSMGAFLGRGDPYPCRESVALGQETAACPDQRIVWGTLHRSLGLSAQWYLLAHVLESWTPWVVARGLDYVLKPAAPASAALPWQIALAWLSFAIAIAAGVAAARLIRARVWPAAIRGLLAAAAVWAAMAIGAWRTLWFLAPTQLGDLVLIGLVVAAAAISAAVLQQFGLRAPRAGFLLGCGFTLVAAYVLYATFGRSELGGLMLLLPTMAIPLVPWVHLWERLSRSPHSDSLETALFSAGILSAFVALLLPAGA